MFHFEYQSIHIDLLLHNLLDHHIQVQVYKLSFVHLGYSFVHIDFVLAIENLKNNVTWKKKTTGYFFCKYTIDCDPDRECICPGWFGPTGPIVPACPGPVCPFWCGNVWKFIAFVGSISSRKPSKWKVAYGQISSSMPCRNNKVFQEKKKVIRLLTCLV